MSRELRRRIVIGGCVLLVALDEIIDKLDRLLAEIIGILSGCSDDIFDTLVHRIRVDIVRESTVLVPTNVRLVLEIRRITDVLLSNTRLLILLLIFPKERRGPRRDGRLLAVVGDRADRRHSVREGARG